VRRERAFKLKEIATTLGKEETADNSETLKSAKADAKAQKELYAVMKSDELSGRLERLDELRELLVIWGSTGESSSESD
jgi:hypothetical protein